jgi:hypothetical protein
VLEALRVAETDLEERRRLLRHKLDERRLGHDRGVSD